MSNLRIQGTIHVIGEVETFDSGFQKRMFVVETSEQYPQKVKFEFMKDSVSALDNYKVGDNVEVDFNVRGNEYKEKYYVNLNAWKINKVGEGAASGGAKVDDGEDDLPF